LRKAINPSQTKASMAGEAERISVSVIIPRPWEPGTFAAVTAEFYSESELPAGAVTSYERAKADLGEEGERAGNVRIFKELLTRAVTRWVRQTEQGKGVWRGNNEDFNIGDACEWQGDEDFAAALSSCGIAHLVIETFSDGSNPSWDYDDKLVDEDAREEMA